MRKILALQKLEVAPGNTAAMGNSCTSSLYTCCNGDNKLDVIDGN